MSRYQILFLLMVMSFTISAQEEWPLERCIQHALENNLSIKQSEYSIDNAAVNEKQAKHSRYPSLNSGIGINSNFGRSIDPVTNEFVTTNFVSNGVSLNSGVTLFNGFRISNTIKQSAIDKNASEMDLEQTKRDIALSVANSYLQILFAEENVQIFQSQLETFEEQLVQTQKLIDAGVRPPNESLDILAQIANSEQAVIGAENNKQISLLSLKQLLRLEPNVSMIVQAPEDVQALSDPDLITFNDVYTKALSNQPNVKASTLRAESARLGEKIAKSGLMPSIGLSGSVGSNYSNKGFRQIGTEPVTFAETVRINNMDITIERDGEIPLIEDNPYFNQLEENLSYGVGLNVSYPIYNNYSAKANIQRSKISTLSAQTQVEQLKDQLKNTIQQALADAKAAKRKLNASERSVEAQKASFSNAEKRFNAGTINSFEYVSNKNALAQAELNAIISKYEYLFALKIIDFYMGKPIKL